eukprot:TRINITY_DN15957_c0_g3_i1.p1 TRINITY_DN15957_c0_g3~~TRINITY_DN15957_c0_g3_i1.p1  ORF type:complete len:1385 (+),score=240.83 TRINITY_DN15957_c0_g3_i1:97-4251(+)
MAASDSEGDPLYAGYSFSSNAEAGTGAAPRMLTPQAVDALKYKGLVTDVLREEMPVLLRAIRREHRDLLNRMAQLMHHFLVRDTCSDDASEVASDTGSAVGGETGHRDVADFASVRSCPAQMSDPRFHLGQGLGAGMSPRGRRHNTYNARKLYRRSKTGSQPSKDSSSLCDDASSVASSENFSSRESHVTDEGGSSYDGRYEPRIEYYYKANARMETIESMADIFGEESFYVASGSRSINESGLEPSPEGADEGSRKPSANSSDEECGRETGTGAASSSQGYSSPSSPPAPLSPTFPAPAPRLTADAQQLPPLAAPPLAPLMLPPLRPRGRPLEGSRAPSANGTQKDLKELEQVAEGAEEQDAEKCANESPEVAAQTRATLSVPEGSRDAQSSTAPSASATAEVSPSQTVQRSPRSGRSSPAQVRRNVSKLSSSEPQRTAATSPKRVDPQSSAEAAAALDKRAQVKALIQAMNHEAHAERQRAQQPQEDLAESGRATERATNDLSFDAFLRGTSPGSGGSGDAPPLPPPLNRRQSSKQSTGSRGSRRSAQSRSRKLLQAATQGLGTPLSQQQQQGQGHGTPRSQQGQGTPRFPKQDATPPESPSRGLSAHGRSSPSRSSGAGAGALGPAGGSLALPAGASGSDGAGAHRGVDIDEDRGQQQAKKPIRIIPLEQDQGLREQLHGFDAKWRLETGTIPKSALRATGHHPADFFCARENHNSFSVYDMDAMHTDQLFEQRGLKSVGGKCEAGQGRRFSGSSTSSWHSFGRSSRRAGPLQSRGAAELEADRNFAIRDHGSSMGSSGGGDVRLQFRRRSGSKSSLDAREGIPRIRRTSRSISSPGKFGLPRGGSRSLRVHQGILPQPQLPDPLAEVERRRSLRERELRAATEPPAVPSSSSGGIASDALSGMSSEGTESGCQDAASSRAPARPTADRDGDASPDSASRGQKRFWTSPDLPHVIVTESDTESNATTSVVEGGRRCSTYDLSTEFVRETSGGMEKLRQKCDMYTVAQTANAKMQEAAEKEIKEEEEEGRRRPCFSTANLFRIPTFALSFFGITAHGHGVRRLLCIASTLLIVVTPTAYSHVTTPLNTAEVMRHLGIWCYALGGFGGIVCLRLSGIQSLLGPKARPLELYAEALGFLDDWKSTSLWRFLVVMSVWACALLVRALVSLGLGCGDLEGVSSSISVATFTPLGCLLAVLSYCQLHVCCGLELAIDRFCLIFFRGRDLAGGTKEWSVLQAMLRRGADALDSCFLVLNTFVLLAFLFMMLDGLVKMKVDESSLYWQGCVALDRSWAFLPVMLVLYSVFMAASVSEKCSRVPALVNSWSLEADGHLDHGTQLLVRYIHNSEAGFYVKGVRLTASMALKLSYLLGVVMLTLITQTFLRD